jgi:hypothetical protein
MELLVLLRVTRNEMGWRRAGHASSSERGKTEFAQAGPAHNWIVALIARHCPAKPFTVAA